MANEHLVRFEPVDLELLVPESKTILQAAFDQGIMLMHGCKEGQCAACKSFLLEGDPDDVEHDKYSTFALPDFERDEGHVLLCRAHAYGDLTIELLNYDEEVIKSGIPIQDATVEVVSKEKVTRDLCNLRLRLVDPPALRYFPGQYVDFKIPGTDICRSFSMASTPTNGGDLIEFVIKIYPDGHFSQILDNQLAVGDRLEINGPYGMFTLRENPDAELLFLGGGAGMAPILSLLRSMAENDIKRPARFYYGARTKDDLCFEDELRAFESTLADFRYIPALSDADDDSDWDGATGFITDVLRGDVTNLDGTDVYICGPPPMVEAALEIMPSLGANEKRIFFDKFTTSGEPESS
ncbi:NADH:ubiquinone reductase (Na(+)-transporting) subunit F [[Mycobacterium] crassicus]|uniref:2Fe-2S iron-sulfur cluster binding domain-containing protein n=1 Tax=[Mycobacterium] crassicus TaxID=2872309 RepID=A0ABU5XPS4_9MYCO|nr:2Fe-2S iron-sulfur cluster binding domain-containing protein [Mycolicibacter sp. MYC098]MEB3023327.1 2Fe-2S iron-sulfur cluster binding domain-containing protein [Mycolicibacter sp. MYC098]